MAGLLATCMMPASTKACAERGQHHVESTCRYSVGLARPRGSNPLSPGRDPSSHEGLSVLGSQRASAPDKFPLSRKSSAAGLLKEATSRSSGRKCRTCDPPVNVIEFSENVIQLLRAFALRESLTTATATATRALANTLCAHGRLWHRLL